MVKVTFRENDGVRDIIEDLCDEGIFDGKSDFYRFASQYTLSTALEDYEPDYQDFQNKINELENIKDADIALGVTTDQYFQAFDYAVSMRGILQQSDKEDSQIINQALERTNQFLENEFPRTYTVQDLE